MKKAEKRGKKAPNTSKPQKKPTRARTSNLRQVRSRNRPNRRMSRIDPPRTLQKQVRDKWRPRNSVLIHGKGGSRSQTYLLVESEGGHVDDDEDGDKVFEISPPRLNAPRIHTLEALSTLDPLQDPTLNRKIKKKSTPVQQSYRRN